MTIDISEIALSVLTAGIAIVSSVSILTLCYWLLTDDTKLS